MKPFELERIGRILEEIEPFRYGAAAPAEGYLWAEWKPDQDTPLDEAPVPPEGLMQPFSPGQSYIGADIDRFFTCHVTLPAGCEGRRVALRARTGFDRPWSACDTQVMVWCNGRLVQGMDQNHRDILLPVEGVPGSRVQLSVWAHIGPCPGGSATLQLQAAARNEAVWELYFDLLTPFEVARYLPENDLRRQQILEHLIEAVALLDLRATGDEAFYASVPACAAYMKDAFYGAFCGDTRIPGDPTVWAVGHTHIDCAWRWTFQHGRDKTARSFPTQMNLMDEYPDFIFMSSQPLLYEWLRERAPRQFERLAGHVRGGQWEPDGAMWVEADCNVPSGESLVRQVLRGTAYFEKEYAAACTSLWLPDVFGYSAQLPAILRGFGIEWFMTTKLSWNTRNCLPHDTFLWQGLDGSTVNTHFITTQSPTWRPIPHVTTYNGVLEPAQVMATWDRYQDKGISSDVLTSFGHGDGGGGVMPEMIEMGRRMAQGIPGCPRVRFARSADFFRKLSGSLSGKDAPRWVGELYLEFHRGTYTSIALVKQGNRRCEQALYDLEWLSAQAAAMGALPYPRALLEGLWEQVLTRQFHDVLPGSSIAEVYRECRAVYARVLSECGEAQAAALRALQGESAGVAATNTLSFPRTGAVSLPEALCRGMAVSQSDALKAGHALVQLPQVPGGASVAVTGAQPRGALKHRLGGLVLENDFCVLQFDPATMQIASLSHKPTGRELTRQGGALGRLRVWEDLPHRNDAWELVEYYRDKGFDLTDVAGWELVEQGPVRMTVRIQRRWMSSLIVQDVSLYADQPGVYFHTVIDWKERHQCLKAAFDVDIHAEKASYEVQFGVVERPTHANTSWDEARFEVCAQRFMDLSEHGFGAALLNDGKYGHDALEGGMALTLLKCATYPSEEADRERHEFTYAFLPHEGGWREGGVAQAARSLNAPFLCGIGAVPRQLFQLHGEGAFIEAVKLAEDGDDLIVRVSEGFGGRCRAMLLPPWSASEAYLCDLNERIKEEARIEEGAVAVPLRPYQIATVRLRLSKENAL